MLLEASDFFIYLLVVVVLVVVEKEVLYEFVIEQDNEMQYVEVVTGHV